MRLDPHFGMLPERAFLHYGDGRITPQGGGGIPIVSDVFEAVGDIAGDIVDAVGDAVSDIGDAVGDVVEKVGDTIGAIVEDPKKLAMVAISVMAPGAGTALGTAMGLTGTAASVVGSTLINTALNGGDVKSALLASAIPVVGREAADLAASAFVDAGLDTALAESAGKIVTQTGMAAATGRDPLQALIAGGLQEAVPTVTGQIEGFEDMSPKVQAAVNRAIGTTLMGGDPSQSLINAAISAGTSAAKAAQAEEASAVSVPTEEQQQGSIDQLLKDLQPYEEYKPSTDYSVDANYELFPSGAQTTEDMGGAQGVTAPELPDVFTPSGEVDYGLFAPTETGGEPALQMPETPNLDSMGGGQGLTIPVEGGTMTESGLIPDGYTPDLGDPESFINQPAPTSGVDIAELQKALSGISAQNASQLKAIAAQQTQNQALQQQLTQQGQNQSLLNMLMMAGLSDAQQTQQQPVQVLPADVKSFEEQGYGELFGPKLSFSDGGSIDDLIALLRG